MSSLFSYSLLWGTDTGFTGGVRIRNHYRNLPVFLETWFIAPALINLNWAANMFRDYNNEVPPENAESPAQMFNLIGAEYLLKMDDHFFNVGAGIGPMSQISSTEQRGGFAAVANLGFIVSVSKKYAIEINGHIGANVLFNGETGIFGGPSIGFVEKD